MTEPEPTWGGARPNAGRKPRKGAKSTPIWCGQMEEEERDFILHWLKPIDRKRILLRAAERARQAYYHCDD